jgi:formamidopyrimidine-DNA glycosylase
MPELPEVEINRRNLERWTLGRTVVGLRTPDNARFDGPASALMGARFSGWGRHGKLLHGRLDNGAVLQSHLGMTGQWVADPAPERRGVRVVIDLSDGGRPARIALVDPRRFGHTAIIPEGDPAALRSLARLGPDALLTPLSPSALGDGFAGRRTPLKSRLMDQSLIAGLGNIAVIEIAHRARLHPHVPVRRLATPDLERIVEAIADHIAYVLDAETGDEIAYLGSAGATNPFICYGREGEPCPGCGAPLSRGALGGRPSFWCSQCQPLAAS